MFEFNHVAVNEGKYLVLTEQCQFIFCVHRLEDGVSLSKPPTKTKVRSASLHPPPHLHCGNVTENQVLFAPLTSLVQ